MYAGTKLKNPCTDEALEKGEFYHAYPLDDHSFIQCDWSGFAYVRPCPPSLVWSADDTTCVRDSVMTAGDDDKGKYVQMGGQHQQQSHGGMQQNGGMASWTAAGQPGRPMNNMQPWMMMVRLPHIVTIRMHFTLQCMYYDITSF